ncbi:MAG TPA: serine/threonine-protein kinase [Herpetosiphonaceae bacterium]|nr:serine/threonine-protein kinase [Herpetosiphonaceae bacterium]
MTTSVCPSCQTPVSNAQARNCTRCGGNLHSELAIGSLVAGQYSIIKKVGHGGSGQIYLAEDTRTFNRRCVLKRTLLGNDPAAQRRFAAEAETLTRLRHPQVPQIYAFFNDTISVYIVMEYIAGRDLEQGLSQRQADGSLLPGTPRPAGQVIHDGVTVCSILEHLHTRTPPLVHCDIKPANLIRDAESNALFLVDFGAAAATGAGENFGTPGYAAPEMYQGKRMPASDIYALGATLYHLLTDDDPCEHPLKFPKLNTLPQVLRTIIEQTVARDPKDRPSATELRQALERCQQLPLAKPGFSPPGGIPENATEFVAAARANWGYTVDALVDGLVEQWLRDHRHAREAIALNQLRPTTTPDLALEQLLRWLMPSLPPVELRFSHREIELSPQTGGYQQLHVTARGGMARVKLVSAPMWLQVAPPELILRPNTTAAFNLAFDPDRVPNFNRSGAVTLEARLGAGKEKVTIPVSIGDSGGQLQATRKRPIQLASLLIGLVGITVIGLMLALIFPGSEWYTLHLCAGAMVGIIMSWIFGEDWIDLTVMIGGGGIMGMGSTILAAVFTGGALPVGSLAALFVAIIATLLACFSYQWLKP